MSAEIVNLSARFGVFIMCCFMVWWNRKAVLGSKLPKAHLAIAAVLDSISAHWCGNFGLVKRKLDFPPANHYLCVMHDSRTIANQFLSIARERGTTLTPMQLLKLVYIAHGWSLGLYSRALIRDEVQAWQYGPVIPRLYNAVKDFRGHPVTGMLKAPANDTLNPSEQRLVEQVFDLYGSKSGPALSRLTHAPKTPWANTFEPNSFGIVIPDDVIEDHYQQRS